MSKDAARAWPWPDSVAALEELQRRLAEAADVATPWIGLNEGEAALSPAARWRDTRVAAVFAAFPRGEGGPGAAGQRVAVVAVLWQGGRVRATSAVRGLSGGSYQAGLLALRCGPLLAAAVVGLRQRPDLVLADATGRDHPRRAGLAVHLGAHLDVPSIGVTNRALEAEYDEPSQERLSASPLHIGEEVVGYAVRTRAGARPVLAHAGWRTTPDTARDLVLALSGHWRTPMPLRAARTLARTARAFPNEVRSRGARA